MDAALRRWERRAALGDAQARERGERLRKRMALPISDPGGYIARRVPARSVRDRFAGRQQRLRRAFRWALSLAEDGGPEVLDHAWATILASRFPYLRPDIEPGDAARRAWVDVRRRPAARMFSTRLPRPASPEELSEIVAELRGDAEHQASREDYQALLVALPAIEHHRDWARLLSEGSLGARDTLSKDQLEHIRELELDHIGPFDHPALFARLTDRLAASFINLIALLFIGLGLTFLTFGIEGFFGRSAAPGPIIAAEKLAFRRFELASVEAPSETEELWTVSAVDEDQNPVRFSVDAELAAQLREADGVLAAEIGGRLRPFFPTDDAAPSLLKAVAWTVAGGSLVLLGLIGLLITIALIGLQDYAGEATWPNGLPVIDESRTIEVVTGEP